MIKNIAENCVRRLLNLPLNSRIKFASYCDLNYQKIMSDNNDRKDDHCNDNDDDECRMNKRLKTDMNDDVSDKSKEKDIKTKEIRDYPITIASGIITKWKTKKFVVCLSYCGHGYYGMQRQSWDAPLPTIEGDMLKVFWEIGSISEENYKESHKMRFQRAARTDKGVSAVKQIVSLFLPDEFNKLIPAINERMPKQIRINSGIRVTKYFDSKNFCDARTYNYVMPSYALCPMEELTCESFRINGTTLKEFNDILHLYKGAHNFHNYTSQKGPSDPSAIRMIIEISCGEPFVKDDAEYLVIRIKGQSFMLHQIRKMIGLAIAVMKGFAVKDTITKAFNSLKLDIPRAPGLGLMLDEVHYDRYNKRYGGDGIHDPIVWDDCSNEINEFKHNCIYPIIFETEKKDKSMLEWMKTLPLHTYDVRTPGPPSLAKTDHQQSHEISKNNDDNPYMKAYILTNDKRLNATESDNECEKSKCETENDDGNDRNKFEETNEIKV